jgi:prepilin peptidase CpaA
MMTSLYMIVVIIAFLLSLYAAFSDYKSLTIPNWISLAITALYAAVVLVSPVEINWIGGLLTGLIVLVLGFALFAAGLIGGGDVKILAALGFWAGPELILSFLFCVALAGGVLVLFILVRNAIQQAANGGQFLASFKINLRSKLQVPYGVAIALGGIVIFYNYVNVTGT